MLSLWANWLVTKFGLNSLKRYLWTCTVGGQRPLKLRKADLDISLQGFDHMHEIIHAYLNSTNGEV